MSAGLSDDVRRIITEKQTQNAERKHRLQERVASAISKSRFFISGSEIDVGTSDAASAIVRAFIELVNKTYTNLKMLGGITYRQQEIETIIRDGEGFIPTNLSEAEQEVLNHITRNSVYKATVKSVLDTFQKIPYGWSYDAVLCHIAKLYARRKIEIKENSNILEDDDTIRVIKNTAKQDNLILQPTASFSPNQIRQLKDFYKEFCNEPIADNDAKTIAGKVNEKIKAKLAEVTELLYQKTNYPFIATLTPIKDELANCADKPYTWYFNEFTGMSDNLLNHNENLIMPIIRFMNGAGKGYYDEAKAFISEQSDNLHHINAEYQSLSNTLSDMNCYKGNTIQQLRDKVSELKQQISAILEQERQTVLSEMAKLKEDTLKLEEWNKLAEVSQQRFLGYFDDFETEIKKQRNIPILKYNFTHFKDVKHVSILNQINEASKSKDVGDTPSGTVLTFREPERETIILASNVSVRHNKTLLTTEADVEEYLSNLRKAMLGEISDGKKIKI